MSIIDAARLRLKGWLRQPLRQTETYLRSLIDGTFLDQQTRTTAVTLRPSAAKRGSRGGILILDYALPTPDRDAGSRTAFEHIVCLVELGYEAYFWPSNGLDVPRYAHPLRRLGVSVIAGYLRPSLKAWLAKRPGVIRHVLLNRPNVAEIYLETLRAANLPILYYGHDLHFARLGMEAERTGDATIVAKAEEAERLERKIWRRVAVSTYPASDEADRVAALEPHVSVQPLPAFCFDDFPLRTKAPGTSQIMFVGSFRHPPNVTAAEWLTRGIFPLVLQRLPEARLVIAGAYVTEAIKALASANVEVVGWLSDADLAALYAASRVAVVPLLIGAGVKLKVVEALHNGVPLVTTTVGAQGLDGLEMILPVRDDAPALADEVVAMLQRDDAAWLDQSHAQLGYVRDHFSRDAMKRALSEVLELAASIRPIE